MQDHRFEWDDDKARANLAKHSVSFEDASRIFDSSDVVDEADLTMDYGEVRYRAVGLVKGRFLAVFFTFRGDRTRIISARKASRAEIRNYVKKNS